MLSPATRKQLDKALTNALKEGVYLWGFIYNPTATAPDQNNAGYFANFTHDKETLIGYTLAYLGDTASSTPPEQKLVKIYEA